MNALGYQRLADPLPRLPVLGLAGPASPACCSSTTTSSSARRSPALTDLGRGAADGDLRRHRRRCSGRSSAPRIVVIIKNVVSAYIERWNLVLGVIFVAHHQLHAGRPGAGHRAAVAAGAGAGARGTRRRPPVHRAGSAERAAMTALTVNESLQVVRRPARHQRRQPRRRAGRAPADHRPQRRRQDHAVQPDHRRDRARQRLDPPVRPDITRVAEPPARRISAWRAPTRSSRCSRATPSCATSRWRCSACRRCAGIRSIDLDRQHHLIDARARGAGAGRPRPSRRAAAVADLLRRAPPRRDRHGAGAEPEGAAARRAVRRPVDRRAPRRAEDCCAPSRATSRS